MKTTKEIAADCGLDDHQNVTLGMCLSSGDEGPDPWDKDWADIIAALYRRIELFEAAEQRRADMGIQTEDAKWLDPECHKGCQSLVIKGRISRVLGMLIGALEGLRFQVEPGARAKIDAVIGEANKSLPPT